MVTMYEPPLGSEADTQRRIWAAIRVASRREPEDLSWQDWALCVEVDPEIFFPPVGSPGTAAKRICRDCPVREECDDYATRHGDWGIWGGTSHRQRENRSHENAA